MYQQMSEPRGDYRLTEDASFNARSGPLRKDAMDQVTSDINDPAFLSRYQEGLKTSRVFRNLQIAPGNYGESGTHEDLARQLIEVELPVGLKDHPDAMALLMDGKVEPFRTRTPAQCARVLIQNAVFCSAKMNLALEVSSVNGFAPFADATPLWIVASKQVSARGHRGTQGATDHPAHGPDLHR